MVKVSIIMPCYNASTYLREAIDSIQSQSFKDWELLIVDDGSTDNSQEIAKSYAAQDKRIILIIQPNSGACRARNNGIEHASGEFIKFLDADDILEPGCLETQMKQIKELSERQIPFGDYYNVDKVGNITSRYIFDKQEMLNADPVYFFFIEWHILISTPLHRTTLIREIGGFNESLNCGQELDMHMRLALANVEFIYRPCITFRYREHNAASRISNKYHEGTIRKRNHVIQHAHECEKLLLAKYSFIPEKYKGYFVNMWFGLARDYFAIGYMQEGISYFDMAKKYGLQTRFQKIYNRIGHLIGYELLEWMFQIRLKILRKK